MNEAIRAMIAITGTLESMIISLREWACPATCSICLPWAKAEIGVNVIRVARIKVIRFFMFTSFIKIKKATIPY
jgi:hypothetical protein